MNNVLIGGPRKEICKLFELLLWQSDRTFTNAVSLDRCVKQTQSALPDLLIVDATIDTPERCFNALAQLKQDQETAGVPIVVITDPVRDGEATARLMLVADEHIQEPFNPAEIKSIVAQFI
jgi:CheY-like chemotaxis protein